ncbi:hypothetical protein DNU06_07680 [Putridiphycobacter roseus]|uniref:Uncharacterized protein n=2 Tax=Putridiphycobacter roseus TaxID=2219161 RepID=A0A2W1N3S9_9FLAO|nr:hypothetical protein DNU06_07680 [Putridiphycobacter roseus]
MLSCKKNQDGVDMGYAYFPTDSGNMVTYQVEEIFHDIDLIPAHDTSKFQIKEVVGELFLDDAGNEAHKIYRYKRGSETDAWVLKDVWSFNRLTTRLEIVEENVRFVDFVFTPTLNKSWDKNGKNTQDAVLSNFLTVNKPFEINSFQFDSTSIVSHQNFTSFVDHMVEYDIFAKGIGKIKAVHKNLVIDNFDTLDIKKGTEVSYQVIAFSN